MDDRISGGEGYGLDRDCLSDMRSLMNAVPGGICALDVTASGARVRLCNDGVCEITGCTRETLLAASDAELRGAAYGEDRAAFSEWMDRLYKGEAAPDLEFRLSVRGRAPRWVHVRATRELLADGTVRAYAAVMDIDQMKKAERALRVSERIYRVAADLNRQNVALYDIQSGLLCHNDPALSALGLPRELAGAPDALLARGLIDACGRDALLSLAGDMAAGASSGERVVHLAQGDEAMKWCRVRAIRTRTEAGERDQAAVVYEDVTEEREMRLVFDKWRQGLKALPKDHYTLYRCNLSKGVQFDETEGGLLDFAFDPACQTFDARARDYADRRVHPDDRAAYLSLMRADALLDAYQRGDRRAIIEYRELTGGASRYLRLTAELAGYADSGDVSAYLLYEDIDDAKRSEIARMRRLQNDPLTGAFNRETFISEADAVLSASGSGTLNALLTLDLDGFRQVNDSFGHAAGDHALADVAARLRAVLRQNDLLGRLDGDEFAILLTRMPYETVVEKRAAQICELLRKSFAHNLTISASVGIALFPRDGVRFDQLYRCADAALCLAKRGGRDDYLFYRASMETDGSDPDAERPARAPRRKNRMLVADDNAIMRATLSEMFGSEFDVCEAESGQQALDLMRRFGAGLSVALLDLVMPGMDGFEVLEKMRQDADLRGIPVVVVSGADEMEASLKAIALGASDFVTKPIDARLIRLRVDAALRKSDNERLRVQNGYLQLQGDEEARYRLVLESTDTAVIEYDSVNGAFSYDPLISHYMSGTYDGRDLWRIFEEDRVAGADDIRLARETTEALAADPARMRDTAITRLRIPSGETHVFRLNVFKRARSSHLANAMILTLHDINDEALAERRLRYQAEHDHLTGLYNRETFLQMADALVTAGAPGQYIFIYLDVENFKVLNELYGHAAGDRLLCDIADNLSQVLDRLGGFCCRISADRFAAVCPSERALVGALSEEYDKYVRNLRLPSQVTVRFGLYKADDLSVPASAMIDRAALAQKEIKHKYGADRAWYDDKLRTKLLYEQELIDHMGAALENGEFKAYLQPQYDHGSGALVGAEALARWIHPEKGMISPGVFIPLFERNGFITRLDEYIWDRTATLMEKWIERGLDVVPVSVNVSRLDVYDPRLCEKLTGIVKRHRLPASLFRLEITESAFVDNKVLLSDTVSALRDRGFLIEMDDFGSGYSSLNVLKSIPVDVVKLDMRFLSDEGDRARGASIVGAILRMLDQLNLPVIAEGIETRAEADFLFSLGCRVIQGYLYAKPMPAEDYEKALSGAPRDKGTRADKRVDIASLQKPESFDTLLFNNLLGAACVFERREDAFSVLRANEECFRVFGARDASLDALARVMRGGLSGDRYARCMAMLDEANGAHGRAESVFALRGGELWLKASVRLLAEQDGRRVFYAAFDDVTERERGRARIEARLNEREALLRCVRRLREGGDGRDAMADALRIVAGYYGADRCIMRVMNRAGHAAALYAYYRDDGAPAPMDSVDLIEYPAMRAQFDQTARAGAFDRETVRARSEHEYNLWLRLGIRESMYVGFPLDGESGGMLTVLNASANQSEPGLLEEVAHDLAAARRRGA